jgi:hypothetical protein
LRFPHSLRGYGFPNDVVCIRCGGIGAEDGAAFHAVPRAGAQLAVEPSEADHREVVRVAEPVPVDLAQTARGRDGASHSFAGRRPIRVFSLAGEGQQSEQRERSRAPRTERRARQPSVRREWLPPSPIPSVSRRPTLLFHGSRFVVHETEPNELSDAVRRLRLESSLGRTRR